MIKLSYNFLVLILLFLILSCSGNGSNIPPTTNCSDLRYNALTFDSGLNTINFNINTTGSLNTSSFATVITDPNPFNLIGNVKGTYDMINDRYVYLGEYDNNFHYILVENVHLPSISINSISIAGASNSTSGISEFTGAVFADARLFVAELDPAINTFWISEIDPVTGGNNGVIFSDLISNFQPTIVDSFGIRYYADTNRNDKIYFLGKDKLLEIDIFTNVAQYYTLPTNFAYIDLEVDINGFLISVRLDSTTGLINLVSWDLFGGAPNISENILIQSIAVESESISLVYKDCDNILHILNHKFNNNSSSNINSTTILEYELTGPSFVTSQTFTGDFIFGYSHLEL